jgi:hypothetical protein
MKEKKFSQFTIQLIIQLFCLFILTSCSLENYVNVTQTTRNKDLFNATLAIDVVKTQTITPTEIRSTATPEATVTLKPMKTITNDEVVQLIQKDWKCTDPCWLGIRPGISTWENVVESLQQMGMEKFSNQKSTDGTILYTASLLKSLHEKPIYAKEAFIVNNGTVIAIKITSEGNATGPFFEDFLNLWKKWSPKIVFEEYGPPDIIKVGVFIGGEYSSQVDYSILMIYETKGFSLEYTGMAWDEENLIICPGFTNPMNTLNGIKINIFDSAITTEFALKANDDAKVVDRYKNLSEVTNQSINEFSKNIVNRSDSYCISAKRNNWVP